jgi:Protein of unknown function (DUF4239)
MILINWFYVNYMNTPAWIVCLLAVGSSIVAALLGLLVFRKLFPNVLNKANNDFISLSLSTVGLFSSVLISLIVVNTWNFYTGVEQIVSKEGHAVEDFYRAAQGMPEPTKSILIKDIKSYIEVVTKEEWPQMNANNVVDDKGRRILLNSYNLLLQFKTHDPIITNIHSKLLSQLSNLFDARRDRILSTKTHVPGVIWLVMFLSACLTIFVSYLYMAETFAMHVVATGFITASLASTLFLIVIFAHPYQGSMRIEPETFINFQEQNLK